MSEPTRDFAGKTVLITGAASGIGRETAFAFAQAGAALELVDVAEEGLQRTGMLCEKLGARVQTHRTDVSSAEAMAKLAQHVHARVPALDVLVNNAGVGVAGSFVGTQLSLWHWAWSINVMGVVHGCHFFLPRMIERARGGHVVNVASAAGLAAPKGIPIYATTKYAVVGLSEALRGELRPQGIGVTTLCPGVIDTPIVRNTKLSGDLSDNEDFHEQLTALYRRRNYGPHKVAEALIDAVRHKRGLVPVTPEAWLMYLGKRLAPGLIERVMNRNPLG
jgi:NAD(P)-dependent dehydrogenase (short-subunit alcohol dehydrogenase family)